jgi:N-acetylglucosamine kinase-like BadF-type ATPase
MGKGEEMALALGSFAHQIKDLAEQGEPEAKSLFEVSTCVSSVSHA